MSKALTAAMAAVILGSAICATAAPAEAHDYHGGYSRGGSHRHGNSTGTAIAAGVVGLALGAALASSNRGAGQGYAHDFSYGRSDYGGYGYQARDYAYQPAYRVCDATHWVWDPYIRRNVLMHSTYAC